MDPEIEAALSMMLQAIEDQDTKIARIEAELAKQRDLNALHQTLLPAGKLPFVERLPPRSQIVKLHADLFRNKPKQGVPAFNCKVMVTLADGIQTKDGSIMPLNYWMNFCDRYQMPIEPHLVLATYYKAMSRMSDAHIGCITHRGAHVKGIVKVSDQVAIIRDDELHLMTADDDFNLGVGKPLKSEKDSAPIMRWTWYLNAKPE